jgi:hypothetical protein
MVCRDEASSRVRWRRTAIRNSIKGNCDFGVAIFNLGPAVRYEVRPMRRRHSRRTYDKRKLVFHRTTKVVSTRSSPPLGLSGECYSPALGRPEALFLLWSAFGRVPSHQICRQDPAYRYVAPTR